MFDELCKILSHFIYRNEGRCFYCNSPGEYQLDHFPVPASVGGKTTVRACLNCHNIKDRVSETFATEYLASHLHECADVVLSDVEAFFICGRISLLPLAALFLLDDMPDYPAALRLIIARQMRLQLQEMHSWSAAT